MCQEEDGGLTEMSMSGRAIIKARRAKVERLLEGHSVAPKVVMARGLSKTYSFARKYGDFVGISTRKESCTEHRGGVTKRGKTKWERK